MSANPKPPSFIEATAAPTRTGSRYPKPHNLLCMARTKHLLGNVFGLTQFGVNLAILPPGCWSSQRHWHEQQEEFIYVVSGELVLVDDDGEHLLKPGTCAGFKANTGNGHHLKNMGDQTAQYLEVGTRTKTEVAWYSDIDLKAEDSADGTSCYVRKDGSDAA